MCDLNADESDQVEHNHCHLHQALLRPPVRGVISDLRGDDGLPGCGGGCRVLTGEGDIGGDSGHLRGIKGLILFINYSNFLNHGTPCIIVTDTNFCIDVI